MEQSFTLSLYLAAAVRSVKHTNILGNGALIHSILTAEAVRPVKRTTIPDYEALILSIL
jgi:hypothetical protein